MLSLVITSLLFVKTRSLREIIPLKWKEAWVLHWELRILVLLSLTFQIILILLGSNRKKIRHDWIRVVVWSAYLSADTIATYALGVIRIEPLRRSCDGRDNNTIEPIAELRAFWASFLLMHLGAPDAITAYAMEDNELWHRHLLQLVSQTAATVYILFVSWNGSVISWLFVVVLICGLIKYVERVWVLRSASTEQFRDSTPERHQKISKVLEEKKLKEAEGHVVVPYKVIELHEGFDRELIVNRQDSKTKSSTKDLYQRCLGEILAARGLVDIFRPAFTDQLLSLDDGRSGWSILKDKNYSSVFNIISIELGFIYDLLFTKAMVFQSPWSFAVRVFSLSLTVITMGTFSSLYRKKTAQYNKIDLNITFVLVLAAVSLELYAFLFQHLLSDKVICWLVRHKYLTFLSMVNRLCPLYKRRRWSGKIGQFSLLTYALKEKHYLSGHEIRGIQKHFYQSHLDVSNDLKVRLYDHIKGIKADHMKAIKTDMYKDLESLWNRKWKDSSVQQRQVESLTWSIGESLQFDRRVLIWHIATEICVRTFHHKFLIKEFSPTYKGTQADAQTSLALSRYMLHLLVMYPSLLPTGIGRIEFKDMHSMMTTFFEQCKSAGQEKPTSSEELDVTTASFLLLEQVNSRINLTVPERDKSKSVMYYGCKLASQLMKIDDYSFIFELLRETWIGMLILAALECKASYHLQQLRRGGELLTHVWLLMVHFGLSDHFKILNADEIAELNIR